MGTIETRPPLQTGDLAPDFTLPAIDRDGDVSLADYRGKQGLLLCLFRGLILLMTLVDLAQNDQGNRQMVELAQLPIQIDRSRRVPVVSKPHRRSVT